MLTDSLEEMREVVGGERNSLCSGQICMRVSPPGLAWVHDLQTYQVMGIFRLWLTFESNGWHIDSCLGNGSEFEEKVVNSRRRRGGECSGFEEQDRRMWRTRGGEEWRGEESSDFAEKAGKI